MPRADCGAGNGSGGEEPGGGPAGGGQPRRRGPGEQGYAGSTVWVRMAGLSACPGPRLLRIDLPELVLGPGDGGFGRVALGGLGEHVDDDVFRLRQAGLLIPGAGPAGPAGDLAHALEDLRDRREFLPDRVVVLLRA